MKKTMKRMALFMSLLATMAVTACLTACDFGEDEDKVPNALDYVSINITRCERVGSVLQIDFDIKNLNKADINIGISNPNATDDKGTSYNVSTSTGDNNYEPYYSTTSITITGNNTIKGHAKISDFDALNEAKSIKLNLTLSVYNIDCEKAIYSNNKIAITDNRIMEHGVQTNDVNLAWSVTSCTRDSEGNLLLNFKLKNNTGNMLETFGIGSGNTFDNIGNQYYQDVSYRWGNEGGYEPYYSQTYTNIPAGGTVEGTVKIKKFNSAASEVTVYLKTYVRNYITSDDTVRFLTIPVTK